MARSCPEATDTLSAVAGYSKTPLAKKLGIREGVTVHLLHGPDSYDDLVAHLPDGATIRRCDASELPVDVEFIHLFAGQSDILGRDLPAVKEALAPNGVLWISWLKKAAQKELGLESDLDGGKVRQAGQDAGLVDVKVCAVDDSWSGHKFVYRLEDR